MRFPSLLATPLLFAISAQAGVLMVARTETTSGGQATTSRMLLDAQRLRVETTGAKQESLFIYRGDQQTIYIIDPQKKTYQKMTKQQLEQLGDQMAQMKKMLDEQMKNMPPQQRQMMEQMMKGKMAAMGGAVETTYRKVSSGQTVGQWSCDKYEGYQNNEKSEEVWTTDWKQFGLTAGDFQVMQDLAGLFKSLASRIGIDIMQISVEDAQKEGAYSGVPVQRVSYRDGKPRDKYVLTEISRQSVQDSLFEVPQGFREIEMKMAKMPEMPATAPAPLAAAAPAPQAAAAPEQPAEKLDCPEAIRRFRAGSTTAATVQASCPVEIAGAIVSPTPGAAAAAAPTATAGPAAPGPSSYDQLFSSEPAMVQNGQPVPLSGSQLVRTAVRSAADTAIRALAEQAVRQAIQSSIRKAVRDAAVQSAAGSLGGVGGSAVSALGGLGFGRNRARPGFEFVVMEAAKSAVQAAAGDATFLVPAKYQNRNLRLIRTVTQEGFRVLESRKGGVTGKGEFKDPAGASVRDEIALQLVQTATQGLVYKATQALVPGQYALVDDEQNIAFDFSVQ